MPEETELFPNRSDAVLHLLGFTGFWGGGAALGIAVALRLPSLVVIGLLPVVFAGAVLIMNATRRLEEHLTGRKVRPWPFGYPGFRTQVKATMPWTIADAANRLAQRQPHRCRTLRPACGGDRIFLVLCRADLPVVSHRPKNRRNLTALRM